MQMKIEEAREHLKDASRSVRHRKALYLKAKEKADATRRLQESAWEKLEVARAAEDEAEARLNEVESEQHDEDTL